MVFVRELTDTFLGLANAIINNEIAAKRNRYNNGFNFDKIEVSALNPLIFPMVKDALFAFLFKIYHRINNGITKSELSKGTHLSKTAINELIDLKTNEHDFRFGTLIKVLDFLKIKLFIGKNEESKSKVLSLFNVSE